MFARCFVVFVVIAGLVWGMNWSSSAQSGRKRQATTSAPKYQTQNPNDTDKAQESKQDKPSNRPLADNTPVEVDENGSIKLETSLVTIPVSVIDQDGKFVPNLAKRHFKIYEDGIEQEIESFEAVETPFNVVLLLDTSNSTMFKLEDIQNAAIAFVDELRHDDRVMVISFDSRIRVHCEFTSDRDELRYSIRQTRTGGSTRLYEAVNQAVDHLDKIEGRKAIVLFTDGVDTSSRRATYRNSIERVEESGAIAYPIRYDTEQDQPRGGVSVPPRGNPPVITNPWPLPGPSPRGRRRWPFPLINHQFPQGRWPGGGGQQPGGSSGEYRRAERYLQELADRSGGRLHEANSLYHLAQAFSRIAEELRHQYALSYYPSNAKKDGTYRRIKVRVEKPGLIVRAREGYRAMAETQTADQNERPALKRKQPATQ
jgi:VWFA-related protein